MHQSERGFLEAFGASVCGALVDIVRPFVLLEKRLKNVVGSTHAFAHRQYERSCNSIACTAVLISSSENIAYSDWG
ncbi:hypothetical protein KDAU_68960 [Dictyobacter aurantiacus]|uniref:Uncharacterized protein n=1 Tax=Dictyobacter aurantiacus TaxID=1936993 RepID=A0A401ZRQ9_9CHLR|nr:hypothetical protein KDAU_68960 [Dictyobacter aurantiacus]